MKYLIRRYAYLITKVCKNNNHSNYLCRKLHAFFMSLVESTLFHTMEGDFTTPHPVISFNNALSIVLQLGTGAAPFRF